MERHLKLAALLATVAAVSLVASEARANNPTTRKNGATNTSNKLQPQGGSGSTSSPSQPVKATYVYRAPPGGWKFYGPVFNQPTKPTFPYRVPPGGWKVYGGLFGTKTPPTPTQPPMGNGRGHGFGGGSFGGGAVVTTPVGEPAAAPATVTTDNAANALELAAGSSFTLKGEKFGHKEGRVGVIIATILIPTEVTNWSENAVTVTVPPVGVNSAAKAMFVVERADGSMAKEINFDLVAAK